MEVRTNTFDNNSSAGLRTYGLDQPIVGESKEVNESVQGPKDEDGDVQVFPMQQIS